MPATTESLRALLGPVVADEGWEIDDLSITPAGRRSVLRVTVDGDVPIDLDGVADISRVISAALDEADAFGTRPYVLEVSSPGVERPLTELRHWRRATGRLVELVPNAGTPGHGAPLTGRLVAVTEDGITLDVEGVPRQLTYAQVARARVQVEFRRDAEGPDGDADDETDDAVDGEIEESDGATDPDDDLEATDEDDGGEPDEQQKGGTPWIST